ncbi:CLUMA_CG012231, isoform A [Clunio marinus]|uniref:CLUMA_CG012231, isoform A n=1 Tax=Clunio marinus TaxID=568069 RepID=A0A1J1IGG3_9DIPT|nr:CLUMA_CG012231, isoform A [Clunio marinus]
MPKLQLISELKIFQSLDLFFLFNRFWFFMATFLMNSMESVKLHCSYELFNGFYYPVQAAATCRPQKFRTTFEDRNVSLVNNYYDSFDIIQFYGEKQSCTYFPVNLGSHFPQLQTIVIRNSNLQFLFSNDLDGLNNLILLDVSFNPIEYFHSDLFKGNEHIVIISCVGCHLRFIDSNFFDKLPSSVEIVDFEANKCIHAWAYSKSELETLGPEILKSCDQENKFYDERIFDRNLPENLAKISRTTEISVSTETTESIETEKPPISSTPCLSESVTEKIVSENPIIDCMELKSSHIDVYVELITLFSILIFTIVNVIILKNIVRKLSANRTRSNNTNGMENVIELRTIRA